LERRLSAEEWAALPFVKGTTKPCSVSVGGKVCGGEHRHAKCPMVPAAKAEKAAKAAVSGRAAAIFTLPGQDPGQAPTAMRIAAAPPYRRCPYDRSRPLGRVCAPVAPAVSATWELDVGMVLQVLFVLLLFTIVHVVASAPAPGAVDQIVGVVTSQPMYSFTDVAVSSMALFVLGGSASRISPVFSLLIALVVFAVGAYRARRLASADHEDSSSDSTPPCSDSDGERSPILLLDVFTRRRARDRSYPSKPPLRQAPACVCGPR
jgi:hypothetical protein